MLAPRAPTNKTTGTTIDYFLMSESLAGPAITAEIIYGCIFSPHVPIRTSITVQGKIDMVRHVAGPRLLPVERPIGPQVPAPRVLWEQWLRHDPNEMGSNTGIKDLDRLMSEWHAGAEQELLGVFGLLDDDLGSAYRGLGHQRVERQKAAARQHRHTPDWQGRLGHRLAWTARQLHFVSQLAQVLCVYGETMVETHGREEAAARQTAAARKMTMSGPGATTDDDLRAAAKSGLPFQYVIVKRIGAVAATYLRIKRGEGDKGGSAQTTYDSLREGLKLLASTNRAVHGRLPLIDQWCRGEGQGWLVRIKDAQMMMDQAHLDFARSRSSRRAKETRHWAATASQAIAHRVTKAAESVTQFSASANKRHMGSASPQEAVDQGIDEWAMPWDATPHDESETILNEIEAVETCMDAYAEIPLPNIDDEDIHWGGRSFAGRTAVGVCGLRPRHTLLLSRDARRAMGRLLMSVEKCRRWPKAVWAVVEVALSKKTGGSRLVGLSATVYRMWARIRFRHIRSLLEQRIERPYLAAAPKRGAARAAFEVARATEAAAAKDLGTAGSMVDIASFYEYICPTEYARAALRFGVPKIIIILSSHIYLAPRRLRIKGAYSTEVFPKRSIIAGCTWATAFIRILVIPHVEEFLERARSRAFDLGYDLIVTIMMYVDDVLALTVGDKHQVARFHAWVTKTIINWVKEALKKEIAWSKIQIVAPDPKIKDGLKRALPELGHKIRSQGEVLGTDFSAGGRLRARPITRKRLRKAMKRQRRLKWWRNVGGDAVGVARGGIVPSVTYADAAYGIPSTILSCMRRMQAVTSRIRAVGSSTTVKLALGGHLFQDVDPGVQKANPPLVELACTLWDEPSKRRDHVDAWRKAKDELNLLPGNRLWTAVRGPVGAAMAHLWRVGAAWPRPFHVILLDIEVAILEVPPMVLQKILRLHARRHYDRALIGQMIDEQGWCAGEAI